MCQSHNDPVFKSISQASFEQNAAVLARLAVRYIYKGVEGFKSSGSYLARYNCDERNLVLQDIPNGSLVCINKLGYSLLGSYFCELLFR